MYIAYAPPPPLSRPRQILFLGDAPLPRPTEKDTSTKRGCPSFFGGRLGPCTWAVWKRWRRSASAVNSRRSASAVNSRRSASAVNSRPRQLASLVLIKRIAHVRGGGCWRSPLRHAFGMTPPPKGEARLGSPFGGAGAVRRLRGQGASAPRYQSLCCNPSKYLLS